MATPLNTTPTQTPTSQTPKPAYSDLVSADVAATGNGLAVQLDQATKNRITRQR